MLPYNIDTNTLNLITAIGTTIGILISALTFWKSFGKMKKSDQIKIAHDIQLMLSQAENEYLEAEKRTDKFEVEMKFLQYLNVWEWLSYLIRNKQINKELQDYFKPTMLRDYHITIKEFPSLLQHEDDLKEFRTLCDKWEEEET